MVVVSNLHEAIPIIRIADLETTMKLNPCMWMFIYERSCCHFTPESTRSMAILRNLYEGMAMEVTILESVSLFHST